MPVYLALCFSIEFPLQTYLQTFLPQPCLTFILYRGPTELANRNRNGINLLRKSCSCAFTVIEMSSKVGSVHERSVLSIMLHQQ